MQKSKKILSLALTLVMMITLFAGLDISSFSEKDILNYEDDIINYLTYYINDGEVTITSFDESISGDVVIPDTIEGYPVTDLYEYAFLWYDDISSITIPQTVKLIKCSFPDKLAKIIVNEKNSAYSSDEYGVLFNKDKTELIKFPKGSNITEYDIPDGVISICDEAFSGCGSITTITIPEDVTKIGKRAFYGCRKFENIKLPDSVTTIGESAFSSCSSLTSITIPDNVTTIGESAFSSCSSLTSITIPDNVTTIGRSTFSGCDNLKNVTIGSSVTTIADNAFNCDGVEKYIISEENTVYSSDEEGILFNKDKTALLKYPRGKSNTEYEIPESVKTIEFSAFYSCSNLESITIPDSVTKINDSAFYSCNNLESIKIPDSVTKINDSAFSYCRGLKNIIIPDSVTTIENYAFRGCSNLKSVTIGSGVTTISKSAFSNCIRLEKFIVDSNNTAYSADEYGVLFNKEQTELIKAPEGNKIKEYVVPDSVVSIAENAFNESLSLKSITSGKNLKEIGASAFKYCTNLSEIKSSDTLEIIGDNAFYGCNNLRSAELGEKVTTIGYYAFYACINLEEVSVGENVTIVGGEAFNKTAFKNNTDNWENGGFYIGKVLCDITHISGDYEVNAGTKTIAPGAFANGKLSSVTFPVSVSRICSQAFAGAGSKNENVDEVIILNPYCIIEPDGYYDRYTIPYTAIIKGYKGSTAEEYANNHSFKFVELENEPPADLTTEKATEEYVHKELTTKNVPDPTHDFVGVYVIHPTCVEDGIMVYTCYCGKSYEADVKATGHTDSDNDIVCDICNVNIQTGEVVTKEPETQAPTTEPTTKEPETEPTTKEPVTQAPTTEKPSERPTEKPTEKPTQKPVSDKLAVKGDTVKVDESKKLSSIKTKSSVEDVAKSITNGRFAIVDKDGNTLKNDALVGTGSKIEIMDNSGKVINTYTVFVPNDVDGNGKTTAADARLALRKSAKLENFDGVYALAADENADGKVTAADARKILRISAGLEKV